MTAELSKIRKQSWTENNERQDISILSQSIVMLVHTTGLT